MSFDLKENHFKAVSRMLQRSTFSKIVQEKRENRGGETLSLHQSEHKEQENGLILHITVKGLARLMHREAIYQPDLSIFKTLGISLSSHVHMLLNSLLHEKVQQLSEGSTCL